MKNIIELSTTKYDELTHVIETTANNVGFKLESAGDVCDMTKVVAAALDCLEIELRIKWDEDEDDDEELPSEEEVFKMIKQWLGGL